MLTEYTLKIEFHAESKEAVATFIRALREVGKELFTQAALLSGETPAIFLTVENNEIGTKRLKVFNGEGA